MTRQALEDAGADTIADAYDYLAGIARENNTGGLVGDDYIARGFATDNILFNGNRTGQPTTLDTANVERVEALRGPTATLFGRADPGGLINVVTKQPLSEPFHQVDVTGATGLIDDGERFRNARASLDTGGPIDERNRVRYRFNAAVDYENSFRKDIDERVLFVAPVVEAELGDRTIANLELSYQYRKDAFDRGVFFVNDQLLLDRDFNLAEGQTPKIDKHYASSTLRLDHQLARSWKARLGLYASYNDFDGEGVQVGSINDTAVTAQRRELIASDIFLTAQPELTGEFSTGDVGHTVLFGIDASYQKNTADLLFGPAGAPIDVFNPVFPADLPALDPTVSTFSTSAFDRRLTATTVGVYAQDQIDLSDAWKLLLGLRWENAHLTEDTRFLINFGPILDNSANQGFDDDAFLPRLGIVYRPIDEIALYASYSETYRPPTAGSLTDASGNSVDAEEAENYEVGVKLDALQGRVGGTLAVYRSDKENVLEADPNDPFTSQINLGRVRGEGLEFDLSGEVTENISLGVTYAYTNTRIASNAGGIPKGTRLRNVPRHQASLQAAYRFTDSGLKGLRLFGGLVYESDKKTDTSQTIRTELPSYIRLDLGATYDITEQVPANFLARNVTDTDYYTSAAGRNNVAVGEPLSVALGVRVRF